LLLCSLYLPLGVPNELYLQAINNQAPMESRETKLCNKLYKTRHEQQIFLGFQILKQEQKETANKDFSNTKPKKRKKANQS
jgi:hypothetical protein